MPTIRISKMQTFFYESFSRRLDENSKNILIEEGLNRWYNIRTGIVSIFVVLIPSFCMLLFLFKNLKTSEVVLSIFLGSMLSDRVKELLQRFALIESTMISVERCHHFEQIEPESQYKSYQADFDAVDGSKKSIDMLKKRQAQNTETVVTEGRIEFREMSCKYATSQQPILNKLTFEIKPREKIGVIGRTGSGKSTLIKLLWRALDYYEGDVLIDGKSIKTVDLKSLRS